MATFDRTVSAAGVSADKTHPMRRLGGFMDLRHNRNASPGAYDMSTYGTLIEEEGEDESESDEEVQQVPPTTITPPRARRMQDFSILRGAEILRRQLLTQRGGNTSKATSYDNHTDNDEKIWEEDYDEDGEEEKSEANTWDESNAEEEASFTPSENLAAIQEELNEKLQLHQKQKEEMARIRNSRRDLANATYTAEKAGSSPNPKEPGSTSDDSPTNFSDPWLGVDTFAGFSKASNTSHKKIGTNPKPWRNKNNSSSAGMRGVSTDGESTLFDDCSRGLSPTRSSGRVTPSPSTSPASPTGSETPLFPAFSTWKDSGDGANNDAGDEFAKKTTTTKIATATAPTSFWADLNDSLGVDAGDTMAVISPCAGHNTTLSTSPPAPALTKQPRENNEPRARTNPTPVVTTENPDDDEVKTEGGGDSSSAPSPSSGEETPVTYMGRDRRVRAKFQTYLVMPFPSESETDESETNYDFIEDDYASETFDSDTVDSGSKAGGLASSVHKKKERDGEGASYLPAALTQVKSKPKTTQGKRSKRRKEENERPPDYLQLQVGPIGTMDETDVYSDLDGSESKDEQRQGAPSAPSYSTPLPDIPSTPPPPSSVPNKHSSRFALNKKMRDDEEEELIPTLRIIKKTAPLAPLSTFLLTSDDDDLAHPRRYQQSMEVAISPTGGFDIPSPLSAKYLMLMEDPAYRHAQRAGNLWQCLVGQHVRFPTQWWNGARSPPMSLDCSAGGSPKWSYQGRYTIHGHSVLKKLVPHRGSPGRLLLHVVVQDFMSGCTVQDIAIGCFHPNARGVRETADADPELNDCRDIWLAVRRHSDGVSIIDPLLSNGQPWEESTGTTTPLGYNERMGNLNLRAVFGEQSPLETIFCPENELYDRLSSVSSSSRWTGSASGAGSPAMTLLKEYVFA